MCFPNQCDEGRDEMSDVINITVTTSEMNNISIARFLSNKFNNGFDDTNNIINVTVTTSETFNISITEAPKPIIIEMSSSNIQGERGPQGLQGEIGPQGLQGEIGPQGPPGRDGTAELTWSDFTTKWSIEPTLIGRISEGTIYKYTYNSIVRYRFIPSHYSPRYDAFYSNYDGVNLTNLLAIRG